MSYDALVPLPVFQALKAFPVGSNGFFLVLTLPPGFKIPMIGLSCVTQLSCLELSNLDVVTDMLSGSISYTCRCTHMKVEDLEIIACEGL